MQFFTTVVALFAVGSAALPAIEPRHYGCPPEAPWRMDNRPTNWLYHVCCAYVPSDPSCCNLDGPPGLGWTTEYPKCKDKYGPGPWPEGF